jgi:general nucleoside transport system permease protein
MDSSVGIAIAVIGIAVVKATPLVYASLGGVVSENSGVVNIGLEGMMAGGAFAAVVASSATHDVYLAVAAAAVCGALLGLLLAYFAVTLRADQIVVGMGINVLGIAAAAYLLTVVFGQPGASPEVSSFSTLPAMARYAPIVCAFALAIVIHGVLYRTRAGLHMRAVGEEPRAAATAGIDVIRVRYAATIAGGVLAALGGAYLSIGELDLYSDGMVAGRGFIALAAVIFGKWTPFGAVGACLFFGFFSSLQIALQQQAIPAEAFQIIPYALAIIALAGAVGRSRAPAADGVPYEG